MKFKRINVDTVRCLISEEELWERGLEVEDFLQNDGKAEGFLREIISRAAEEVGYKVKGGNISIQVSVLPDHVLALTFSEKPDAGIMNMLEYLKHAVEHLSQNVQEDAPEHTGQKKRNKPGENVSISDIEELSIGSCMDYQLCFDSLDTVSDYCASIMLEVPLENSLYKLEKEGAYFLLMKKSEMTDKQLCRLLGSALEFASGIYSNEGIQAYIMEHGVALIANEAIQRMQEL